jgi:hypothetical protein
MKVNPAVGSQCHDEYEVNIDDFEHEAEHVTTQCHDEYADETTGESEASAGVGGC